MMAGKVRQGRASCPHAPHARFVGLCLPKALPEPQAAQGGATSPHDALAPPPGARAALTAPRSESSCAWTFGGFSERQRSRKIGGSAGDGPSTQSSTRRDLLGARWVVPQRYKALANARSGGRHRVRGPRCTHCSIHKLHTDHFCRTDNRTPRHRAEAPSWVPEAPQRWSRPQAARATAGAGAGLHGRAWTKARWRSAAASSKKSGPPCSRFGAGARLGARVP